MYLSLFKRIFFISTVTVIGMIPAAPPALIAQGLDVDEYFADLERKEIAQEKTIEQETIDDFMALYNLEEDSTKVKRIKALNKDLSDTE